MEGVLDRAGFVGAFKKFADARGVESSEEDARRLEMVLGSLFGIFDSDSNGDGGDDRIEKLYESLQVLSAKSDTPDRSEQLLKLFSGPA